LILAAALLLALLPYTSGLLVSVTQASVAPHSAAARELLPQVTGKDVAVTSIAQAGPPSVNEGGTVTINIGVSNNGTEQETFGVTLWDDTENKSIASRQLTLAAGESATANVDWDTTGATGGPVPVDDVVPPPGTVHTLTATATLAGDAVDSNNSKSLDPGIWVIAAPTAPVVEFPGGKEPDARETGDLAPPIPPMNTEVAPNAGVRAGPIEAQRNLSPVIPVISTDSMSLNELFREGALTEEEGYLRQPAINTVAAQAETGTIRGRIKLQGRNSSLGSYIEIGSKVTFVDRQGYFLIQRPAGNFDLTAKAPGYLSHSIRDLSVETGETLMLPVVNLHFGDADGDGVIDIYDLTVAAGNYGRTVADLYR
jgi:hypothetical protein